MCPGRAVRGRPAQRSGTIHLHTQQRQFVFFSDDNVRYADSALFPPKQYIARFAEDVCPGDFLATASEKNFRLQLLFKIAIRVKRFSAGWLKIFFSDRESGKRLLLCHLVAAKLPHGYVFICGFECTEQGESKAQPSLFAKRSDFECI